MKIAISGASGFVGSHLTTYLESRGYAVLPLGRDYFTNASERQLTQAVGECDAVINLAGAPIDHRWTRAYRKELFTSRVDTTRRLAAAIDRSPRTGIFISTSAVGYYPAAGCYDEYSADRGSDFLSDLCAAWEAAAKCVRARSLITRFGVVLSADGGAFPKMSRPAKAGVALIAGSGLQPFSWIALDDLLRAEEFLLTNTSLNGVFNFTAPERLTMREFMAAVAEHYRARLTVRVPAFAVRMARGQSADFLLRGQCVVPSRLLRAGFKFEMPSAQSFLEQL